MAELAQCLGFDLPDPLARDAELTPDLLERAELAVVESETEHDNAPFAIGEAVEGIADLRLEKLMRCQFEWRRHRVVLNEITEEGIAFLADRRFE